MRQAKWMGMVLVYLAVGLSLGVNARAQINTAELSGQVLDPQNLAIAAVKVTMSNLATGASQTVQTDSNGNYKFVGLPPGRYQLSVEGGTGFAKLVNPDIVLTIGSSAQFIAHMQLLSSEQTVTVSENAEIVETTRSSSAGTVDQQQINNLPINGRNYVDFSLLNSQLARDSAPYIGAAPTSGLNFGGARARSNEVSVDGADAVDNSVNGIRATVSQEAVQEFQVIVSNYMPEFGRATGGVVNIVTKSGTNQVHGDVFGFLRLAGLQARNPFSVTVLPNGTEQPVKQAYTRVQAGATIGGPIKKDKTFYFLSYETTRRQETGFSDIGAGNYNLVTGSVPAGLSGVPCLAQTPGVFTKDQGTFISTMTAIIGNPSTPPAQAAQYTALLTSYEGLLTASSLTAMCGTHLPGPFNAFASSGAPLPGSYVSLNDLRGNFPISEGTSLWSARLDHMWNSKNSSFLRINVSPSTINGIEVEAQNQTLGDNAGSRTSNQTSRDFAIVGQHVTTISNNLLNEFRYQYARRGVHYGYSNLPGGSGPAVDILGFASFGREPYSTLDRVERRNQWTDDITWVKGSHTFKFGADINLIQVGSNTTQIFELDFGGLYRVSGLPISQATGGLIPDCLGGSGLACTGGLAVPGLNSVQAYGFGIPGAFLQGIGNSNAPFHSIPIGGFAQDSWRIVPRLTVNYGVRYDVELTPLFTPTGAYNAAAEKALGVVEGIPRDYNNWGPRIGLAWDPWGNGKTVVRAGFGLFYDHPLLGIAFNSVTANGSQSVQLQLPPGAPSNALLTPLNATSVLNASTLFQGILNAPSSYNLGYIGSQQRFNPLLANSFFTNQNFLAPGTALPLTVLPWTLPVAANFVYGYAEQGNFAIERQFHKDYKLSIAYNHTRGIHLNRPRNINSTEPLVLIKNANAAVASGIAPTGSNPLAIQVPAAPPSGSTVFACPAGVFPGGTVCYNNSGSGSVALIAPGALAVGNSGANFSGANEGYVGTAAVFNFFRPSGPNPSFATLGLTLPVLQGLAQLAGFPTGPAGIVIPFSDTSQQESSGNSFYDALTLSLEKRFSNHFTLQSSWTWSHAIDDSTDLQSPLDPQDNRNPRGERGNSTFDQRHRWITSAVLESPYKTSDNGFMRKFLANFTVSPIFEVGTGRPFTILTGEDPNLDFSATTARPSLVTSTTPGAVSSPYIPGAYFGSLVRCDVAPVALPLPGSGCVGTLPRNAYYMPGYFTFDMRISRKIFLTERTNLEVIGEGFNLTNRQNIAAVNTLCDPTQPNSCPAGQPTAALDPRQFQFALKINW